MFPWKHFEAAVKIASLKDDQRVHRLGAIGLRSDGVIVGAPNAPAPDKTPQAHAEARLCRKLDKGATVFVARKSNGSDAIYRLARPCASCQKIMKSKKVARVYYTISDSEFGVMDL
jgi:tRNA(Arg) A34 adenosine deaminase TadA